MYTRQTSGLLFYIHPTSVSDVADLPPPVRAPSYAVQYQLCVRRGFSLIMIQDE